MGTLKTIFDIQLLSTHIFQPLHHLESKKWFQEVSLSMKIQYLDEVNKTILPNIELKNGKRRCSHQFSIKALATTSPNGFLAVVVLILPITVQNFFSR